MAVSILFTMILTASLSKIKTEIKLTVWASFAVTGSSPSQPCPSLFPPANY